MKSSTNKDEKSGQPNSLIKNQCYLACSNEIISLFVKDGASTNNYIELRKKIRF